RLRRAGSRRGRGVSASAPPRVDVRAYACPMTYVKAKIALERLAAGERLEVWLAAGEPVENLPRSAAEDGHRVLAVEPLAGAPGAFRVVLEKGAGAAPEWP
ncbi:sulfurtransferase TusA family protein, partial [Anaeromyxobacter sp. SG26]